MSLTLNGYKLYFDTLRTAYPCIHSDTLYGMIISALFDLQLITDKDIASLSLSVSSAFPFYDDLLFFPMPVDFSWKIPDTEPLTDEPWFISSELLSAYCTGNPDGIGLFYSGRFIAEESHPVHLLYPLWETVCSRHGSQAHMMRFKNKAGLYFLIRTGSKHDKELLDTALRYLRDEGIGAGRTVGLGTFSATDFTLEFPAISPTKRILLSLCCPEKDFFSNTLKGAAISWIRREKTPCFSSDREARYCHMMREGSVFPSDQPFPAGSTVRFFNINKRLSIETPIYRFGKTFFLE